MDKNIGAYLRESRKRCHLSLKDVHSRSGITDSRLSRMECGKGRPLSAPELRKLAKLYRISVVPLYLMAGYLSEDDLAEYQLVFRNANLLSDEERESIQMQIDLLTKRKEGR